MTTVENRSDSSLNGPETALKRTPRGLRARGRALWDDVATAYSLRADEYRILTTPTVVREAPAPRRRVTGDLGDTAQVLAALALFPSPPTT